MGFPIKAIFGTIGGFVKSNASSIMVGVGVIGAGASIISAVKSTPLALDRLDEKADECGCEPCELTTKERVAATWKVYLPSALMFTASAGMIIGSHIMQVRRISAVSAAAALAERSFAEYREAVSEKLGSHAADSVREKIADNKVAAVKKEQLDAPEPDERELEGAVRCLEPISGRLFWSNSTKITNAINQANAALLEDGCLSLNEFYDYLDAASVNTIDHIPPGDEIGWNYYRDKLLDVHFTARLADGCKPVLVMDYSVNPSSRFYKEG